ncbi:MAG: hypothetical protein IJX87_04120 [Clostridia bacterium]|nr:hypothetical protein [Clostridia bacterium]
MIEVLKKAKYQGDITSETSYGPLRAPKELQKPIAQYLAAVADYLKNQLEKE